MACKVIKNSWNMQNGDNKKLEIKCFFTLAEKNRRKNVVNSENNRNFTLKFVLRAKAKRTKLTYYD